MSAQKLVDSLEPSYIGPVLNGNLISPVEAEELLPTGELVSPMEPGDLTSPSGLQPVSPPKKRSKWYLVRALRNMMSTKFDAKFTKLTCASRISHEFLYRTPIERRAR
jgi:hypothetical protein